MYKIVMLSHSSSCHSIFLVLIVLELKKLIHLKYVSYVISLVKSVCVHARLHLSAGLHVLIGFREMFHNNKRKKKGLLSVLIYVLVSLSVCFACSYRFYLTWFKSTSHHQNFIIFSLRDEAYTL